MKKILFALTMCVVLLSSCNGLMDWPSSYSDTSGLVITQTTNAYPQYDNTFYGMVKNNSSEMKYFVELKCTWQESNGRVISEIGPAFKRIGPGEEVPFEIAIDMDALDNPISWSFSVEDATVYKNFDPHREDDFLFSDINTEWITTIYSIGNYKVNGTIENCSNYNCDDIQVCIAGFTSTGKLISETFFFLSPDMLSAGETRTFSKKVTTVNEAPVSYWKFYAQGSTD